MTETAQLGYLAVGGDKDYGALRETARDFHRLLQSRLALVWRQADAYDRRSLAAHSAVLDRLSGFLLQVRRVMDHTDQLSATLPQMLQGRAPAIGEDPHIAVRAVEATTDFESLLFHGRAVLDQLTLAVARSHTQDSDRFSKLPNLLGNFQAKSDKARDLSAVLSQAIALEGVLTDLDGRSLRSVVTHRHTIAAGTTSVFTIHMLPGAKQLVFDCEAFGYGVLGASHMLACEVPFVVLNGVAIYMGVEERLAKADAEPPWNNPSVRFSEWLDTEGTGPIFGIVTAMNPDGFKYRRERLRREVVERAIPIVETG